MAQVTIRLNLEQTSHLHYLVTQDIARLDEEIDKSSPSRERTNLILERTQVSTILKELS